MILVRLFGDVSRFCREWDVIVSFRDSQVTFNRPSLYRLRSSNVRVI